MREYWLTIPGFENYEASNLGNIRNKRTGRVLRQMLNKEGGYYRVNIGGTHQYVHRLVAIAFFDEDISGMDINHIDGDHWNNHVSNLEIVTRKENIRHAYRAGCKSIKVVTCKYCKHRDECSIRPATDFDDWFCADGEI